MPTATTSQAIKGTSRFSAKRYWLANTALRNEEKTCYHEALANVFGFYALQMGLEETALLAESRIPHRYLASDNDAKHGHHQLCCQDHALPFGEASLDVLLLPHRLEFSADPHQTLREAARVMVPEGYLLLSGFNPWSLVGFLRWLLSRRRYPYCGHWLSLARVKDWCALLGLEVLMVKRCGHSTPLPRFAWQAAWLRALPALGYWRPVYMLVAKKRVLAVTPLKPQWRSARFARGVASSPPKRHHQRAPTVNMPPDKTSINYAG